MSSDEKSTGCANSPGAPTPAPPTPVTGRARLWLTVITQLANGKEREVHYSLLCLDPHPSVGSPAWRLTKTTGEHYDVLLTAAGAVCECKDFEYRRRFRDGKGCRHICGLRAVGLLGKE